MEVVNTTRIMKVIAHGQPGSILVEMSREEFAIIQGKGPNDTSVKSVFEGKKLPDDSIDISNVHAQMLLVKGVPTELLFIRERVQAALVCIDSAVSATKQLPILSTQTISA